MKNLKITFLMTPLGEMAAITDEQALYFLAFKNCIEIYNIRIQRFQSKTKFNITAGQTQISAFLKHELENYFNGSLTLFKTPIAFLGSPFQKQVWEKLKEIPYGKTCSYTDLAIQTEKPSAFRAVANANGANAMAIIIPCHRVINKNGNSGGYAWGLKIKEWLIQHEIKTSMK